MFDFIVQGNYLLIILSIVLLTGLSYNYWKLLKAKAPIWRFVMITSRTITILILVFLLVNPILNYFGRRIEKPHTAIFIDHSSSIKHHLEKSKTSEDEVLSSIDDWIERNDATSSYYLFGNDLRAYNRKSELKFDDSQTDYSELPDKFGSEAADHYLLITDGIATSGMDLASLNFRNVNPVHTLVVGAASDEVDISIERINAPASVVSGDSLEVTVSLKSILGEQTNTKLEILNEDGKKLYDETVQLQPGSGYQTIKLKIPSEGFTEFMTARISGVKDEVFQENNESSFNLKILSAREDILILSGALSYNTAYIKDIVHQLPRSETHHVFRKTIGEWEGSIEEVLRLSPRMIILDDFPSVSSDRSKFESVLSYSQNKLIPLVYFEGPTASLVTSSQFSPHLQLSAREAQYATEVSLVRPLTPYFFIDFSQIENVPPQQRNLFWNIQGGNKLLEFSDGTPAIYRRDEKLPFIAVFMPQLAQLSLKNSSTEYSGILDNVVFSILLTELLSENNLATVESDQPEYDFGDPVELSVTLNEAVGSLPKTVILKLANEEGELIDQIPARWIEGSGQFVTDYLPKVSGNVQAWSEITWENGEETASDSINISIQDVNVEDRNLTPNINALNKISEMSGGLSGHINTLDSLLNAVKITPVKKEYEFHFSALLTQKYWFVIILLLAVEWWIRKRNGLL